MTIARVMLGGAWVVALAGVFDSQLTPVAGALLTVVFTAVLVLLTAWVRPALLPANSGVLRSRLSLWSADRRALRMEIDGTGAVFDWVGAQGDPMLHMFQESQLTLERYGRQLLVSSKLRDKTGRLVAEIIRNEWKVSPLAWDRNYRTDALEVLDPEGHVALQVRLMPDRVQIQGQWYGPNGEVMRLARAKSPNPTGMAEIVLVGAKSTDKPSENHIERMFKYPSDLHLGELAE
jgi:hypothetical protein